MTDWLDKWFVQVPVQVAAQISGQVIGCVDEQDGQVADQADWTSVWANDWLQVIEQVGLMTKSLDNWLG